MTDALDALVDLLDLERIEVDVFRGLSPDDDRQRVFGGQVAGQALVAAGRTVDDRRVHSLHAYFLRPGDPEVPILYTVDRIRDGRSFTTRRVVAVQHGRAIFNLSASFHVDEPGPDHQVAMPEAPGPEQLPTRAIQLAPWSDRMGGIADRAHAIDVRYVTAHPFDRESGEGLPACQQVWLRADGALPDDPLLHACVVAYASDLTLLDTALSAHGGSSLSTPGVLFASLDHAMWFHRPFRADEWLLYEQESPSGHGARAFARGSIFTRDGHLVTSVAQEGLIRPLTT
ncbi:MAG: acyl-CoA thioesterase [Acidimicrobiales bacterium]